MENPKTHILCFMTIWFDLLKIICLPFGQPPIFFLLLVINFWQRRPSMRSSKLSMSILTACNYLQLPPSVFQTPFSVIHQYHLPDQPHNFTQINHKENKKQRLCPQLLATKPKPTCIRTHPWLFSFPFKIKEESIFLLKVHFSTYTLQSNSFHLLSTWLSIEIYLPF